VYKQAVRIYGSWPAARSRLEESCYGNGAVVRSS